MGNGFNGPPAVDFYSMLSGLGDTIAKNRDAAAKQAAITSAFTPGPDGKIDYNRALTTLAPIDPQAAALVAAQQNHQDMLKQQAAENARNATNDQFNHNQSTATLGLAQSREKREAADYENTPDQYVPNPKAGQPGEPQFIDQYAAATAAAQGGAGKPIPFETLSGTRFLTKQPDGTYSVLNPQTIGQPASQPQPAPPTVAPPAVNPGVPAGPSAAAPGAGPAPVTPVAATTATPPQATPQADLDAVDPQTGRREAWLKSQPPDVQAYIKKIADYEIDPRTTSIKGGHREQVLSAVAQYDPTYDQNTFGSRSKAIKDFSTGQQGNSIRSFDVAIDHLDTLKKYTIALNSGDVRVINSLRNAWMAETGSSLPTNVQAIAPIVGAEVSKAIIGSNNALADREELRKPLALANSPAQVLGAIDGYQQLMGGQLKGLKKQYEDTTGKKDFDKRIRDNTKNVLLGSGKEGETVSATSNVTSSGIKWSVQ